MRGKQLDSIKIRSLLPFRIDEALGEIHVFDVLDSTNTWLKDHGQCREVCLAEQQTAGRGRREHPWFSPDAENIYLSMSWCFDEMPEHFSWLGIVMGIAVCEALQEMSLEQHGLKWPNDIYWQGKKMGGILIESAGVHSTSSPKKVIIGVGLNINMMDVADSGIDQPWCSLAFALGKQLNRNEVISLIVSRMVAWLQEFAASDVSLFQEVWADWDSIKDRPVQIIQDDMKHSGQIVGLDKQGRLGVRLDNDDMHNNDNDNDGDVKYFSSAEISVRW
jgi:BirA family biotin operon repressor/biotin-[acetyl-CoA-carboxylase] ligase